MAPSDQAEGLTAAWSSCFDRMDILSKETIAALATPRGAGGIGIVKISGPDAVPILRRIFIRGRTDASPSLRFDHRRLYYGHIAHPDEGLLDEVLVAVMRGPNSYTTEDVVEINCHGGIVLSQAILDLVLSQGARQAQPGEFTRRAYLGGRINLAQAEAVIDMVNAKTARAARAGLRQLESGIDVEIREWQAALIDALATVEACIDFDDDLDESPALEPVAGLLKQRVLPRLECLIRSYREGRIVRDGLRIVIAGRPNVGKSSLVNRLLDKDRVIVNAAPGTTRDIIEESIAIEGAPVVVTDTAGIHSSADPVEAQGIEKSRAAIERADLVLFMIDASIPLSAEDRHIYQAVKSRAHLVVQNKVDLCVQNPGPPDLEGISPEGFVALSALTGEGLEALKQRILTVVGLENDASSSAVMVNLRQAGLLEAAHGHFKRAASHLAGGRDHEIIAIEIKDGLDSLMQILGDDTSPDVLDHIFNNFCIGK